MMPIRKLLTVLTLCLLLTALAVPVFAQDATSEATTEATAETTDLAPTAEATTESTGASEVTATVEASSVESESTAPTGIGTLVLLVGLGAVVLVGGVMLARERTGRAGKE